jgi:hypothetical protein
MKIERSVLPTESDMATRGSSAWAALPAGAARTPAFVAGE